MSTAFDVGWILACLGSGIVLGPAAYKELTGKPCEPARLWMGIGTIGLLVFLGSIRVLLGV